MTQYYKRITGSAIQGTASTVTEPLGTIVVTNDGQLRLHDGVTAGGNAVGGGNKLVNGSYKFILGVDGTVNFDPSGANGKGVLQTTADLQFIANTAVYTFGTGGSITLPNSGLIDFNSPYTRLKNTVTGQGAQLGSPDDQNYVNVDNTAVTIQVNSDGTGGAHALPQLNWIFNNNGSLTLPGGNYVSDSTADGIKLAIPKPPTTIVISGADFSAVNLTYNRDLNQTTPTWGPPGYNINSDPHIVFDNTGWGIFVPGFPQSLYVNTGSINFPAAQWNTHPPYGSVAPTGVYTYANPTWQFGSDGGLTAPGNLQVNGGKIVLHPYGNSYVESVDYGVNSANSALNIFGGPYQKINLRAGFGTQATWTLGTNGSITFPDNTQQTTAWTGTVAYSNLTGTPNLSGYTTTATVNTLIANSLTNVIKTIVAGTGTAVSVSENTVTIWTTASGGVANLTNLSSDITFSTVGVGAPTFVTTSTGTKISYFPQESANSVDYATGIESGALWTCIPQAASNFAFKWYGGTSTVATLNGLGTLTANKFVGDGSSLTNVITKASGLVNAGVDVVLGNLKARIPTSGNRSLQLSTVSGTYTVYGSEVYYAGGVGGATIDGGTPLSVTTTPAYLRAANNFNGAGMTDTWTIMDTGAGLAWRITCIIGPSYNNNMISIERLV
jgi:hypothetical protein